MAKADVTKEDVIEFIANMSVLELSELVKEMEEKFGVSAAAPVAMMAAGPGDAGGGAAAEEEQTEFDVILVAFGDKKIQVIKEVRAITGVGLKEAKALVDEAPKPVKEGVSKDEAVLQCLIDFGLQQHAIDRGGEVAHHDFIANFQTAINDTELLLIIEFGDTTTLQTTFFIDQVNLIIADHRTRNDDAIGLRMTSNRNLYKHAFRQRRAHAGNDFFHGLVDCDDNTDGLCLYIDTVGNTNKLCLPLGQLVATNIEFYCRLKTGDAGQVAVE